MREGIYYRIFVDQLVFTDIAHDFDTIDNAKRVAEMILKPQVRYTVRPVWIDEDGNMEGHYGPVFTYEPNKVT